MAKQKQCVLLISGGLDSVTLLHYLVKEKRYDEVYGISFIYGQKHFKEIECAKWQMKELGMEHHEVVDLSNIKILLKGGSTLIQGGEEIPRLDEIPVEERTQPPTYVPNRNMIFLSLAFAWAETLGISEVFYSAQAHDEYGYWDCTGEFVQNINQVISLNRKHRISLYAPFLKKTKKEILEIGYRLGVNYAYTWSCYRGEEVACGNCPTCIERLKAFEAIGRKDPIPYQNK